MERGVVVNDKAKIYRMDGDKLFKRALVLKNGQEVQIEIVESRMQTIDGYVRIRTPWLGNLTTTFIESHDIMVLPSMPSMDIVKAG